MASIRFYLNPLKNGTAQIIAAFQDGKNCPTKYTGYNIPNAKVNDEYKYWHAEKQRVRSLGEKNDEINKKLNNWKNSFDSYITDCNLADTRPNIQYFIGTLKGKVSSIKRSASPTLLSVITSFIASIKSSHKSGTKKIYETLKTQVESYEQDRRRTILLSDVNHAFYKDFCTYLIDEEKNYNLTLDKKQKNIITIVNYALNDLKIKLPDSDYKKKFKLKQVRAPKFPLYPEELATLRAHIPADPYHVLVLHAFLIACETGMRYSDITQLRHAHIKTHIEGSDIIRYIDLTNIKGAQSNNMPLSDFAAGIVDQYTTDGPIFRFSASQSFNRSLKQIAAAASLNRPCEVVRAQGVRIERTIVPLHEAISMHMARNTYITRLLSLNVAPVFVKDNAGHSSIDMTMEYNRTNDLQRWKATLSALNAN